MAAASTHPRDHGVEVLLSVEDTGIGIPLAEQGRLFERFFRSSTAQRLGIPGTGLGLSIVHGIATGHAGTVSVISREGDGTPRRAAAAGGCPRRVGHPAAGPSRSSIRRRSSAGLNGLTR